MLALTRQEKEAIVEFAAEGVDVDGNVIDFPPLHVHHVHLARSHAGQFFGDRHLQQHWAEVHGDFRRGLVKSSNLIPPIWQTRLGMLQFGPSSPFNFARRCSLDFSTCGAPLRR
jgi:hypothetical protein